jgi:hypothetical protein
MLWWAYCHDPFVVTINAFHTEEVMGNNWPAQETIEVPAKWTLFSGWSPHEEYLPSSQILLTKRRLEGTESNKGIFAIIYIYIYIDWAYISKELHGKFQETLTIFRVIFSCHLQKPQDKCILQIINSPLGIIWMRNLIPLIKKQRIDTGSLRIHVRWYKSTMDENQK